MQNKNPYIGRAVVLVDDQDNRLGLADIWEAHKNPGLLHRAISVVLWREKDGRTEILLQKRSEKKPLWPLFWSNTVCTHPLDEEGYLACAVRRLREEMGIEMSQEELKIADRMKYQADYNAELSEHELDTIIVGKYLGAVSLNPDEAADSRWSDIEIIRKDTITNPSQYTPWFKILITDLEVAAESE